LERAIFAERLDQACLSKRHATRLGVIYIDLDGFKAVNDGRGHDAGDQVLSGGLGLRACVRDYDVVSDWGDEFAVLATHLAKGRSWPPRSGLRLCRAPILILVSRSRYGERWRRCFS